MEKCRKISESCRVVVDGRTYCIWKIPESENPEVKNSGLADLIRSVKPETLADVRETSRDVIHYDKEKFGYPCDVNS